MWLFSLKYNCHHIFNINFGFNDKHIDSELNGISPVIKLISFYDYMMYVIRVYFNVSLKEKGTYLMMNRGKHKVMNSKCTSQSH